MRTAKRPRAEEDEQSSKRLRPGSLGAAENAPRTSGGATRARNAVDPIAKLASARSEVKALEPFINASLEEMLQHKLQEGVKKYVKFATKKKHCEADALKISEEWLGGAPLLRNCEVPRNASKGRVGVALCTYNCGVTNGGAETLGPTPFALQREGFPANLSMRFLTRTVPMIIFDTNPELQAGFGSWRKFADAFGERFGMYDLVSIALPKVAGVTTDLFKYMLKKDVDKFGRWITATADHLDCFLQCCGGASNSIGIVNACGPTAATNPWLLFRRELKKREPKHAVVAFLDQTIKSDSVMPHASAIINGSLKVGVPNLVRGDEALSRLMSALFLNPANCLSVRVSICYDWKMNRSGARKVQGWYEEKEKFIRLQAVEAAAEERKAATKERRRARDATPEARERRRAREAKPEARERKRARNAKPEARERKRAREATQEARERKRARDAKPEARERRRAYDATPEAREKSRARDAKPEARERKRAREAKPEAREKRRARDAKPEARAKISERNKAYNAKRKAAANAGGTGAAGEGPPEA